VPAAVGGYTSLWGSEKGACETVFVCVCVYVCVEVSQVGSVASGCFARVAAAATRKKIKK